MAQQHLLRLLRDDGPRTIVELARKQSLDFAGVILAQSEPGLSKNGASG